MSVPAGWKRVTTRAPCLICGKPDWCMYHPEKHAFCCTRTPSPSKMGEAGWIHNDPRDTEGPSRRVPYRRPDTPKHDPLTPLPNSLYRMWQMQSDATYRALGDGGRRDLARQLGVLPAALQKLRAGWSGHHGAYIFPMRDAHRKICGLRTRLPDGTKRAVRNSKSGVFMDPDLNLAESPWIFIVEGPTDAAAMLSLGLPTIGRPDALAGREIIKHILRNGPDQVVIIHDDDKPNPRTGKRVGAAGAVTLAKELKGHRVTIHTPAAGFKDIRSWYTKGGLTRDQLEAHVSRGRRAG